MTRTLLALGAVCLGGCNLLTLEGLQAGGEGGAPSSTGATVGEGGAPTPGSSTSTASSSSTASETGSGGSTSGDGGGGSGAGGREGTGGAGGGGGSPGSGGAGGEGGGCAGPTFCNGIFGLDDLVVCDDFDDDDELDNWETVSQDTVDPVFEVVDDRYMSCPHAARIQYNGVTPPNGGGWAEMGRRLDGVPASVTMRARIFREPTVQTPEGNLEILWDKGSVGCFVQARFGVDSVEVSGRQFDTAGEAVVLGDQYVEDERLDTEGRWMDAELSVVFGAGGGATVTLDGLTASFLFDPLDDSAFCDDGPDAGSVVALVGPPYNAAPTVLYVDDYHLLATY